MYSRISRPLAIRSPINRHSVRPFSSSFEIINETAHFWIATQFIGIAGLAGLVGIFMYKISSAHQYIVRTGAFITDVKISKNGFVLPFQKYNYINIHPKTMNLNYMR
jgi:hypothetical protein